VTDQHARCNEFAQLVDQYLLADASDQALEVAEPLRARSEMEKNQRLPFAAHDGERDIQAAGGFVGAHRISNTYL
jgi:hypothetical protein